MCLTLCAPNCSLHWSFRKAFLSLLAILWNSAFRWVYLSFSPLSFASLLFSGISKASSDNHFAFASLFLGDDFDNHQCHEKGKWKWLSCVQLCDSMDYTDCGILQARILEWVAFPFSRGFSQPRDQTQVSHIAGIFLTSLVRREAQEHWSW